MASDSPAPSSSTLQRAAAILARARHVCVVTGAGISAESGIPTFRDALTGLWERFRPEDLATPEAFARDPALVWQWYEWRRDLIRGAQPNAGHRAIVELERRVPQLTLVTQNVDGLHQRAGSPSVVEYHGNILRDRCTQEQIVAERSRDSAGTLPRCAACGGLLRPDVVWFGEPIPRDAMLLAASAAEDCDVLLSVGTAAQVYPAAGLAELALEHGATVIEVNSQATALTSRATLALQGPAGLILPELCAVLRAPAG